jgi:hypothetical protein
MRLSVSAVDGRRRHAQGDGLSGQPLTAQGDDLIDNKELGRAMECARS